MNVVHVSLDPKTWSVSIKGVVIGKIVPGSKTIGRANEGAVEVLLRSMSHLPYTITLNEIAGDYVDLGNQAVMRALRNGLRKPEDAEELIANALIDSIS